MIKERRVCFVNHCVYVVDKTQKCIVKVFKADGRYTIRHDRRLGVCNIVVCCRKAETFQSLLIHPNQKLYE